MDIHIEDCRHPLLTLILILLMEVHRRGNQD